jgi:L-threonylcarbamoyladenylate synthase
MVLDAGKTQVGVESTILDMTKTAPVILRPGGVSMEDLKKVVKDIQIHNGEGILSPGMYPSHYSPEAKVVLVGGSGKEQVKKAKHLAGCFRSQKLKVGILAKQEHAREYGGFQVKTMGPGKDLALCAANLFSLLREFDRDGIDVVIAESVKKENRLKKASGGAGVF